MLTVEVRFMGESVSVRQFGDLQRGSVVRPGETDRLTGWSCEELRSLGEGLWGFPAPLTSGRPEGATRPVAEANRARL